MKRTLLLLCLALMAFTLNAQTMKTLTWGGQERQYLEYVPTTYSAETPAPVLFMLHGLGDVATNFFNATDVRTVSEQRGWIVVCPQALDFNLQTPLGGYEFGTSWNAGITVTVQIEIYGMPFSFDVTVNPDADDSGFLMATLEAIDQEYTVEPDSVFFAGFSLGACMSHRMAIEHGDRINAIAAVSGVVGNDMDELTPAANINVLEIFGTSDEMISYDNAEISLQSYGTHSIGLPAEATVEYWRNFNQCAETAVFEQYPDLVNDGLTFEMYSYLDGANDSRVSFIKVNNGLHRWYMAGNNDISYTEEIAKFFTGTLDVTSVAETTDETLNVYPNPATETLCINAKDIQQLDIFSVDGRLVTSQNKGFESFDVTPLAKGVYLLKATFADGNSVMKKFVKE